MSNNQLTIIQNSKFSFSIHLFDNRLLMAVIEDGRFAVCQYFGQLFDPSGLFESIPYFGV